MTSRAVAISSVVLLATYAFVAIAIAYGEADHRTCFVTETLRRVGPVPWSQVRLNARDLLVWMIPGVLGTTAIVLSRSRAIAALAALLALWPATAAAHSWWTGNWHECDRKGCTSCDGIAILLLLGTLLGLLLLIPALIVRSRADASKGTAK